MRVSFVAEVSSNHNQDIERCKSFIEAAAKIGCSAVKFQLFKVDKLFAPEILSKSDEHRRRKRWELPVEFLPIIAAKCKECGIQFSCTPFYLGAVDELRPYIDFYKIASYELFRTDLITACVDTGKPVVLSTGMATLDEVRHVVDNIQRAGCSDFTLLHCVSGYPTPAKECNLSAIDTLRQNFPCNVGWSDHSVNAGVIYRAVFRWGAKMIEFHLDLDEKGAEYLSGHCWLPRQIGPVIKGINDGLIADGNGLKVPAACELGDRDWRADPSDGLRPLRTIRENWR
jgi:N-acetylneuraminate synthase